MSLKILVTTRNWLNARKPSTNFISIQTNIDLLIVLKNGIIKLGDWSLSAFNVKNRKCLTFCGTDAYMAPEILLGRPTDKKTDIFSLGVCLWIMLCGYYPFNPYQLEYMETKSILNEIGNNFQLT